MATKAQLRRKLLANLHSDVSVASLAVGQQFGQLDLPSLARVLAYYPLPGEIDPEPLLAQFDASVMVDYVLPAKDAPLPSETYDLILIPCLGYTADNYRLGRGGGWYDKLLALYPYTISIGLGFKQNLLAFQPEPHDKALTHIILA